jgi:CRP-like cAMP-binding protein
MLLRYIQASLTQMAQFAICNRYHSIDQQLSLCLLLLFDRTTSDTLLITQETLSNLLGVRREGITEAAGRLQAADVVRYRRGQIQLLDRGQLEHRACECYGVLVEEFDRLVPPSADNR